MRIGVLVTAIGLVAMCVVLWTTAPRLDASRATDRESARAMTAEMIDWWLTPSLRADMYARSWRSWINEAYDGEIPAYGTPVTAKELVGLMAEGCTAIERAKLWVTVVSVLGAFAFWLAVALLTGADYGLQRLKRLPNAASIGLGLGILLVASLLVPVVVIGGFRALLFSIPLGAGAVAGLFAPPRSSSD